MLQYKYGKVQGGEYLRKAMDIQYVYTTSQKFGFTSFNKYYNVLRRFVNCVNIDVNAYVDVYSWIKMYKQFCFKLNCFPYLGTWVKPSSQHIYIYVHIKHSTFTYMLFHSVDNFKIILKIVDNSKNEYERVVCKLSTGRIRYEKMSRHLLSYQQMHKTFQQVCRDSPCLSLEIPECTEFPE